MLEHLTEMFDVSGPIYVNFVATKSFHFPALSKRVHSFDLVFLIAANSGSMPRWMLERCSHWRSSIDHRNSTLWGRMVNFVAILLRVNVCELSPDACTRTYLKKHDISLFRVWHGVRLCQKWPSAIVTQLHSRLNHFRINSSGQLAVCVPFSKVKLLLRKGMYTFC